jgi:hypothetical protein
MESESNGDITVAGVAKSDNRPVGYFSSRLREDRVIAGILALYRRWGEREPATSQAAGQGSENARDIDV